MNLKIVINHILSGSLILAIFYCLRGHDLLTGVALMLPLLFVIGYVITLNHRRRGSSSSGGGSPPPSPPSLTPSPRPTGTPPQIYCEHAV